MKLRLLHEYFIIKRSKLFDHVFYLTENPDVRCADVDPLMHFVLNGWKEGRNPSGSFDTCFYLNANPDVKDANVNPLVHYIRYGRKEGRKGVFVEKVRPSNHIGRTIQKRSKSEKLLSIKNIKRSLSYLRMYGVVSFVRKAKSVVVQNYRISENIQADSPIIILSKPPISLEFTEEKLKEYSEKVSVIIPTKNAGSGFEFLLKVLKNQKGFKNLEIVIVDSGSTDVTLSVAKEYDVKIINILPEEFSHSYARNLGAENASGDYFLFTVQDALPPNETWLYELMGALLNNNVSAVSCAEYPREDADLFYRMLCWNHYNFLDVNDKDRIFRLPDNPNYISLRQNGQLSDLACLIPRSNFMKYKYRFDYAEDLDLGIRLIKDGYAIGFLSSTRIIHSHNRPASYFLKRGYVDNLFLSDLFDDFPVPIINFDSLIPDIAFTYAFVNEEVINKLSNKSLFYESSTIEITIREALGTASNFNYPTKVNVSNNNYVDTLYLELLNNILAISDNRKPGKPYRGFLVNALLDYSKILFTYLRNSYEKFDKDLVEDIKRCMNKELAQLIGAHLAYWYIKSPEKDKERFNSIHALLKEGV